MQEKETIIVLDFGGQYCHLISRRIRDLNVFTEILPFNTSLESIQSHSPCGIILSGGPSSVYEKGAPTLNEEVKQFIISKSIPVLGLCYGHQLLAKYIEGNVIAKENKEYGPQEILVKEKKGIFFGLEEKESVWMSHGDQVELVPPEFDVLASTGSCPIAAFSSEDNKIIGLQFHPEVTHTIHGQKILENFLNICHCKQSWSSDEFINKSIASIKQTVGEDKIILGASGGVDSSVAAVLLHQAIGDNLFCIYVDTGLGRYGDTEFVKETFIDHFNFKHFSIVDAKDTFLNALDGVTDPEEKRKIIGHTFIKVFTQEAERLEKEFGHIKYLAQGTIYPDRIESAQPNNAAAKIKSHHNLALPESMDFKLIEPLADLYKDEVRRIGNKLGLSTRFTQRQPFPGPGLAVRCLGPVQEDKLVILREADKIVEEEIRSANLYDNIWQSFAVLLPQKTVGVMGDFRTYEYIISIRAVESIDAMTANFARLDWNVLESISSRIINEVKGVNRVVYDISNKPPATIEYE